MAPPLSIVTRNLANGPSRLILMTVAGVAIVGFVVAGIMATSAPTPQQNQLPPASATVDSTPGKNNNPEYLKVVQQGNQARYDAAGQTGGSSVPTWTAPSQPVSPPPADPPQNHRQERQEHQENGNESSRSKVREQAMQKMVADMLNSWHAPGLPTKIDPKPVQSQAQSAPTPQSASATQTTAPTSTATSAPKIIVSPGDNYYSEIVPAINSDYPGKVNVKIWQGPLLESTVLCDPTLRDDKISLHCGTLVLPKKRGGKAISIDAWAVDPETKLQAFADDVDHHLEKYLLFFTGKALEGYGDAVSQGGTTISTSGIGVSSASTTKALNGREQVIAAAGAVGRAIGETIGRDALNRPNTVTTNSNRPIGIMFFTQITDADLSQAGRP